MRLHIGEFLRFAIVHPSLLRLAHPGGDSLTRAQRPVLAHHFNQHAFAQAAVGNAQALGREAQADRFENGAAGKDQVGAFAADARIGDAIGIGHGAQPADPTHSY